ncbi:cell surface protein [Silvimonas amylolytica]|uniref:Cell surface protein n=1 Tax=Silvimonas amylolytica TaxID=449663 RepID=A0ABQ2PJ73_9NEIS|nr:cell surface protein [Silvimonas amylolytica]
MLGFTLFSFMVQPVLAAGPIVADPNANAARQPTVQTTANGLPVVNIATPNAAGVSHNQYNQFNVDPKGAVLNNAQGLTSTQLAGYIDGNPNLAGGTARTILNEVTSGNPSSLRGYLEVGGAKANVIVANPNGITCDGCGFINSSRTTLTTGTPIFGGSGSLDAFRVTGGSISITGAGLNANNLDQVDLIARAIQINAGLYAHQLNVVAGANTVSYGDLTAQAIAGIDGKPAVAIDVAQLGGMYADKIHLIGTEAGVGVNLGGTTAVSGQLQIDSAGKLTHSGQTSAGSITLNAGNDVANSGQLYATGNLDAHVTGQLGNTGTVGAAQDIQLQAGSINQQGTLAAGLTAQGQLQGNGALTMTSTGTTTLGGQTVAAGNLSAQAGSLTANAQVQSGAGLALTTTQGDLTLNGATVAAGGTLDAAAAGNLNTRNATVSAQQLNVAGGNIDNTGGKLVQTGSGTMQVSTAGTLTNQGGLVGSAGGMALHAGTVDNSQGGQLQADRFSLTANTFNNQYGSLQQTGTTDGQFAIANLLDNRNGTFATNAANLALTTSQINNGNGTLSLAGTGTLSLTGAVDNTQGRVLGNGNVQINAPSLTNTQGQIVAQDALALSGRDIDNSSGALGAGGAVTVNNTGTVTNTDGDIEAGQGLTIQTGNFNNGGTGRAVATTGGASVTTTGTLTNTGTLGGNADVTLHAGTLNNSGKLSAGTDLKAQASNINNTGTAVAGNLLQLHAIQTLDNSNGKLQGQQLDLAALTLINAHGQIVQTGTDAGNWQITQLLDNRNGSILSAAQDLDLASASIRNGAGTIGHAGLGTLSLEGDVDNTAGQINGNGDVSVSNGQLVNQGGTVGAQNALNVSVSSINNTAAGVLTAKNAVTLGATGTLDNSNGTVEAGNGLTLTAQTLTNNGTGRMVAIAGDTGVTATGTLTNAGLIGGNGKTTVQAAQTTNSGTLTAGTALSVTGGALTNTGTLQGTDTSVQMSTANGGTGALNNQHGNINGAGSLTVTAASLDNTAGHVANSGTGQSNVTVSNTLTNTSGLVGGNGATNISAGNLNNGQGTLTSGGSLGMNVTNTLSNQSGTIYAVGNSTIQAATLDNTSGTVNGHGDVGVNATTTNNGSGKVASDHNITLTSNTLNGLGNVNAGDDLTLNLQGNVTYANGQYWTANHDFNLNTTGAITNQGDLGAVGTLTLTGSGLTNAAGAQLSGNTGLTVRTGGGNIQNNGVMFGNQVSLNGGSITNTNAIFGGNVTLNAGQINNAGNGNDGSAIIAAGRALNLYTNTLNNTGGGDLYSIGDLNIAAQNGSGNAGSVLNQSSTIQGDGNVSIHASQVNNQRTVLDIQPVSKTTTSTTTTDSGQVWVDQSLNWWTDTKTTTTTTTTETGMTVNSASAVSQILAGGNLSLNGSSVNNNASIIAVGGTIYTDGGAINAGNSGSATGSIVNTGYSGRHVITQTTDQVIDVDGWRCSANSGCGQYSDPEQKKPGTPVVIVDEPLQGYSGTISAGGGISGNVGSVQNITVNASATQVTGNTVTGNATQAIAGSVNQSGLVAGAIVSVDTATHGTLMAPTRVDGQPLKGNPVGTGYQLPTSGLYKINTQPGQQYLVETDPRFTQYGNFISSDYMLQRLGLDPSATEKRLGDAFYENKLITDQIAQLTGKRFLDGYTDQSAEYTALMNSGATYAQQFGIAPGVALSAEQMASLTQDMVWLENRVVDGQNVLVPVVYLASVTQNASQTGDAQIMAGNIDLHTGTLTNSGVIQSNTGTVIAATTLNNLGGQITSLGDVQLSATGDLLNQSGLISGNKVTVTAGNNLSNITAPGGSIATIKAGDSLVLSAGHDLTITAGNISAEGDAQIGAGHDLNINTLATTTTDTQKGTVLGDGWYLQDNTRTTTTTSQMTNQTSSISAGGNLTLTANNNATLTGAQVQGDNISVIAGGNVTIQAATHSSSLEQTKGSVDRYHHTESTQQLVGSDLQATNAITIGAGQTNADGSGGQGSLNITSSTVRTDNGQIKLAATGDVNIGAQTETTTSTTDAHQHSSGLLSSYDTRTHDSSTIVQSVGSTISGDSVDIHSGHDLNIVGSNVVATNDVGLKAANNINIVAAENTDSEQHTSETHNSGFFSGGGLSITYGKQSLEQDGSQTSTSHTGSVVGSTGGNVNIEAGNAYTQTDSIVKAITGDIGISGKTVDINAATDSSGDQQHTKTSQSGLTLALSSPVISAIQTGMQMAEASKKADGDPRLLALAGATTGLAGYNAATAVGQMKSSSDVISLSLTVGGSKSESNSEQASNKAQGSAVTAGGSVNITATGGGKDGSHLNVIGSDITAGKDATLKSDGAINLQAAENTDEQHSKNSSASGGVGVGISIGDGIGAGITVNAAVGRGNADGTDTSWTNTHVTAGNKLTIESGGDTNLIGAVANGNQVVANVGGNLNIQSLQDTSKYDSKDQHIGGSITVGAGYSGSLDVGQQKIDADYASVNEQSAIHAGDGGYQIYVEHNTDLKGAVITGSQAAVDQGLNNLDTGTLTTSEIENRSHYNASSFSLSGGYSTKSTDSGGGVGTDQQGKATTNNPTPGSTLPSSGGDGKGLSVAPPMVVAAHGDETSTTTSGISGGGLTIRDSAAQETLTGKTAEQTVAETNRDVVTGQDTSGHIDNNFNKDKVQAAFDITSAFQRETGTFLNNKAKDAQAAQDALKKEQDKPLDEQNPFLIAQLQQNVLDSAKWAPGGDYRQALTALIAASGGNATGGMTQLVENTAVGYIQSLTVEQIKHLADSMGQGTPEAETARTALQALVACAGASASGASCTVAASGAAASVVVNNLLDTTLGDAQNLTPEQKETRANAIESLISGVAAATGSSADLGTVKGAAQIETENNALAAKQVGEGVVNLAGCLMKGSLDCAQKEGNRLVQLDQKQSEAMREGAAQALQDRLQGVKNLPDSLKNLANMVESDPVGASAMLAQALKDLPANLYDEYKARLTNIGTALTIGGVDAFEKAGNDLTNLAIDIAMTYATAGAAKAGAKVTEATLAKVDTLFANGLEKATATSSFDKLVASGGTFAADGKPLMNFNTLSNAQKSVVGELLGQEKITQLIPDAEKIGRSPGIGQTGIDDLYKVSKPGVDYVVVEYKFGSSTLGDTLDGKQMSDGWLTGINTNYNRLAESVGNDPVQTQALRNALNAGRIEKWVVYTDKYGNVGVGIADANGKLVSHPELVSKITGK